MVYLLGATTNGKVRHKVRYMKWVITGGRPFLPGHVLTSHYLSYDAPWGRVGVHDARLLVLLLELLLVIVVSASASPGDYSGAVCPSWFLLWFLPWFFF